MDDDALHPLKRPLLERFRREFGEPDRDVGRFQHWALRPPQSTSALHILVNTSEVSQAEVWLFDPTDAIEGVTRETIRQPGEIEPVISRIQWHVRAAERR
ncbi:MAG: hypothetical protein ACREJO_16175 [Phycisphaerales bacterium]